MARPGLENIPFLSTLPDIPQLYYTNTTFSFFFDAIALSVLFGLLFAPLGMRVLGTGAEKYGKKFGAVLGIIIGLFAAFALRDAQMTLFGAWFRAIILALIIAVVVFVVLNKLLGEKHWLLNGSICLLLAWFLMDIGIQSTANQNVKNIFGIFSFISMLGPIIFIIFLIYAINKMPAKTTTVEEPTASARQPAAAPAKAWWKPWTWFKKKASPPETPAAAANTAQELSALLTTVLRQEFKNVVDAIKGINKAQQADTQIRAAAENIKSATAPQGTVTGDNIVSIADAPNALDVKLQELDAALREKLNALVAIQKNAQSIKQKVPLEQAFENTVRERLRAYDKIVADAQATEASMKTVLEQITLLSDPALKTQLLQRYEQEINQPFQAIKGEINTVLKPSMLRMQEFLTKHQQLLGSLEMLQRSIEGAIANAITGSDAIARKPPAERSEAFLNEIKQYAETLTTWTCPKINADVDALNDATTALSAQKTTIQKELTHAATQYADMSKRQEALNTALKTITEALQQAEAEAKRAQALAGVPALEIVYKEINDVIEPWMTTITNVKKLQKELIDVEEVFRKEKEGKTVTEAEWKKELDDVIATAKTGIGQLKIDEKEIGEAISALDQAIPRIETHKETTTSAAERDKLNELLRHLTTFKEQIGDMKTIIINVEGAIAEAAFDIVKEKLRDRDQQWVKAVTIFKKLDTLLKPLDQGREQLRIIRDIIKPKTAMSRVAPAK